MRLLNLNVVDCLHYRILVLAGEIDYGVGDQLLTRIVGLLTHGDTPLLIDMTGVTFCDSTGLRIAVAAKGRADACQCALAFCGLTDRVRKVFHVSGLDRFVATYPTLADAARDLTGCDHVEERRPAADEGAGQPR